MSTSEERRMHAARNLMDRLDQKRTERSQADTARATSDLRRYTAEQHEENRRLRYLTTLLSFAVLYDVVNGSFDDHTWWTTLISVVAGVVVGGALLLGKLQSRRANRS